jgi:hypothetical protein
MYPGLLRRRGVETMDTGDLLQLVVEASLALAGFAGVVNALAVRRERSLATVVRLRLVNLLSTSFASMFLSLGALGMLSAGLDESLVWRVVSGVGLLVSIYFSTESIRTVARTVGREQAWRNPTLWMINLPFSVVCGVQVWNVIALGAFWAFFLLVVALFAIGCASFVSLLFARTD